ncbi:LysR family transcriptional regulator [Alteromonas gracilis]|uniref:LysR family transcriptional regulator n=1 Tax=Alteromonas gracilis TaxID=1479524 RepID=UPI0037356B2D
MKDWNDYSLILALHRAGTLRGAAIMLGTTHTTVARRLSLMHKQFNATIFERIPGGYRATPLGEQIVTTAKQIESLISESERGYCASDNQLTGPITLSLGEPMSQFLLTKELGEFTKLYPSIQLKVKSSTAFANLDKGEADVVIRGAYQLPEHLIGRRLYKLGLCFYAHKDYCEKTPRSDWQWVAPLENQIWPQWLAESPYPDVPIGITIDDIVSRYHAIINGVGMGRTACFMGDVNPDLVRLPGSDPILKYDIWILTHPDLYEQSKVKLLMQFLTDTIMSKRDLVEGRI